MTPHVSAAGEHRPGDRFRFGPFEVRPVERRLVCQDVPVIVGSRAMDILLCLLERQGDVVSSAKWLTLVWRGLNVEPAALRFQISGRRKALAEPTQAPATHPPSPAAGIASSPRCGGKRTALPSLRRRTGAIDAPCRLLFGG
jgi:hypothetical protein